MKAIKKILSIIGILAIVFVVFAMLGDGEGTYTVKDGDIAGELNQKAGAEHADEYSFELDNGDVVSIKLPKSLREDKIKNLTDERERAIFDAIYEYDQVDDVYITPVPNDEQTFREMLKASDAVGTLFNFTVDLVGPDGGGMLIGDLIGDNSVESLMSIDPSYIGEEKDNLMGGETISFDVVYAGLDISSDPLFIALNMQVVSE